jgi:hypothetical protein
MLYPRKVMEMAICLGIAIHTCNCSIYDTIIHANVKFHYYKMFLVKNIIYMVTKIWNFLNDQFQ